MEEIQRDRLLNQLMEAKDTNLIKVITGVRRCGKSSLLKSFREKLIDSGTSKDNIISINFEDLSNEPLTNYQKLHQYVVNLLKQGMNYVFLDEIQMVEQFEKVVDSLYIRDDVDLYITGSNSHFMSGEFATLLTGRYVEINVYPYTFSEFVSAFPNENNKNSLFEMYLTFGGFPEVVNLLRINRKSIANDYLIGVYNTILNKDIVPRFGVSNLSTLNNLTKYLLDNVGNFTSPKSISNFLTSNHNKTSYNTVDKYLNALESGLIFYSVDRENIKEKQILQTLQKHYVVDLGLRRAILAADVDTDMGHLLENIVYFELIQRRNTVTIGKSGNQEIDFVVKNIDTKDKCYYQVSYSVKATSTLKRELSAFDSIRDHNPKYLLTTDTHQFNDNGIKHINVIDWLLKTKTTH